MKPIRIIGIGSPFAADRLGWDAISQFKNHLTQQAIDIEQFSFITLDRPGAGLIDYMEDTDHVILIDAVKTGDKPGTVVRLQGDQIESIQSLCSTHGFGVAQTVSLARVLHKLPRNLVLIGMEAGDDPEWMPSSENMQILLEFITCELDARSRQLDLQA